MLGAYLEAEGLLVTQERRKVFVPQHFVAAHATSEQRQVASRTIEPQSVLTALLSRCSEARVKVLDCSQFAQLQPLHDGWISGFGAVR